MLHNQRETPPYCLEMAGMESDARRLGFFDGIHGHLVDGADRFKKPNKRGRLVQDRKEYRAYLAGYAHGQSVSEEMLEFVRKNRACQAQGELTLVLALV